LLLPLHCKSNETNEATAIRKKENRKSVAELQCLKKIRKNWNIKEKLKEGRIIENI